MEIGRRRPRMVARCCCRLPTSGFGDGRRTGKVYLSLEMVRRVCVVARLCRVRNRVDTVCDLTGSNVGCGKGWSGFCDAMAVALVQRVLL